MIKQSLNGIWKMICPGGEKIDGEIPGSVYSFLLNCGKMEDPYYRENELEALALVKGDYTFKREFDVSKDLFSKEHLALRFKGIDTIADVLLNGLYLGSVINMHRCYEFDVRSIIREHGNVIEVKIKSPTEYIEKKDREYHVGGSYECMRGFPYLRKAHCMFGWDWGPRLPDEGIWKDVDLIAWNHSRIEKVVIHQEHMTKDGLPANTAMDHAILARQGKIRVRIIVTVDQTGDDNVSIKLINFDNSAEYEIENGKAFEIPEPKLWWPNGLGDQPLYTIEASIVEGDHEIEKVVKKIGLRTAGMCQRNDKWGKTFCQEINGQTYFAMGADYVPEDNILSRCSRERTEKLLDACVKAGFNSIRVWGGGYYPVDWFYDLCDEKGLVIWQDMMFACAHYKLDQDFVDNITEEIKQNTARICHHASLALLCGNNEMEQFEIDREYEGDDVTAADYLIQNEYLIPKILHETAPDVFYWPSSPSSGGKFVNPRDENRGDIHYWDVWHGRKPFTEYRKFFFRYLSEFGFQSFPDMNTVKSFTEPKDRNVFSRVMERHQRNCGANGALVYYLSQNYLYPSSFELLVYTTQLLQADAIRYGVEHFRRNRNNDRCMGAIYWQLNDIWPVASWASIDYYGHWKALHYAAARFFNKVMISCEENCEANLRQGIVMQPEPNISTARLCVTNEGWDSASGLVKWELRDSHSNIALSGQQNVTVAPFSSLWLEKMDFSDCNYLEYHLDYFFVVNEEVISRGTVLFTAPKHYRFVDPEIETKISEDGSYITVSSKAYAKSVEIYSEDGYIQLSDNYFDMEADEARMVKVIEGSATSLKTRSVFDIH